MSQAKNGDTVKVHYVGTLTDGTLFDSSQGRDPLELTLGAGSVIPGFDSALVGMSAGENKTPLPGGGLGRRLDGNATSISQRQQ